MVIGEDPVFDLASLTLEVCPDRISARYGEASDSRPHGIHLGLYFTSHCALSKEKVAGAGSLGA
jgi:hypothetical protein